MRLCVCVVVIESCDIKTLLLFTSLLIIILIHLHCHRRHYSHRFCFVGWITFNRKRERERKRMSMKSWAIPAIPGKYAIHLVIAMLFRLKWSSLYSQTFKLSSSSSSCCRLCYLNNRTLRVQMNVRLTTDRMFWQIYERQTDKLLSSCLLEQQLCLKITLREINLESNSPIKYTCVPCFLVQAEPNDNVDEKYFWSRAK